jgi:hypothetical protein
LRKEEPPLSVEHERPSQMLPVSARTALNLVDSRLPIVRRFKID